MKKIFILVLILTGMALPAWSHAKHHYKKTQQSMKINSPNSKLVVTDQIKQVKTVAPSVIKPSIAPKVNLTPQLETENKPLIWMDELFSHIHNKIIHFPIALAVTAAFFIILSRKTPEYETAYKTILIIAALFSIMAYFTGKNQEGNIEGKEFKEIIEIHERLGIITTLSLIFGVVITQLNKFKSWLWLYGLLILALVILTGFYGGILAHN